MLEVQGSGAEDGGIQVNRQELAVHGLLLLTIVPAAHTAGLHITIEPDPAES